MQHAPEYVDFAILTAIEVERRAACAVFGLTDNDRVKKDGRWYWFGSLRLHDGNEYRIVIAQPSDMGNVEAALLAAETIRHWNPSAALLMGIAASTNKAVKLGDVVVARSVYYYEHGKVTAERIKPQPEMIPADARLLRHLDGMAAWNGAVNAPRPAKDDAKSIVHVGVIACGEKVIAHAPERDAIAAGHRKILALEMEGYGFSRAAWQSHERVGHLVIRGICDDGSRRKDDRWHGYAAAAAATLTRHFLLDRPIPPRVTSTAVAPTTVTPLSEDSAQHVIATSGGVAILGSVSNSIITTRAPEPAKRGIRGRQK